MCSMRSAAAAVLAFCLTPGVHAGDGVISAGRLHLLVYLSSEAAGKPADFEPLFDAYSDALYDATQHGLQLGTVRFTDCERLRDAADIWILPDQQGARAHRVGLGTDGRHIFISQKHKSISGNVVGPFALVHESGHYLFGLLDEYRGRVGDQESAGVAAHFCSTSDSSLACVMDGGSTIFPNRVRTEFCTSAELALGESAHHRGTDDANGRGRRTDQEYFLGRSCWEQIESSRTGSLTHPTSEPTSNVAGRGSVTFDTSLMSSALVLVLDRSGSLLGVPFSRMKQAARNPIASLAEGDFLGVVSFASKDPFDIQPPDVIEEIALAPVDAVLRASAVTALDAMVAQGGSGGTSICEAIDQAVSMLASVPAARKSIVLFTDSNGLFCQPTSRKNDLLLGGIEFSAAVLSTAFLDPLFEQDLRDLATQTGGSYHQAASAAILPEAMDRAYRGTQAGTAMDLAYQTSLPGGGGAQRNVSVLPHTTALRAALNFPAGAPVRLVLRDPGGRDIDAAAPPPDVTVTTNASQIAVLVTEPAAGSWTATLSNLGGPSVGVEWSLVAEQGRLAATLEVPGQVKFPAAIPMRCTVNAGVPVAGATVEVVVTRPDATQVTVELHDDGLAVHADELKNDGIYSGRFTRFAGNGSYAMQVTARAADGEASGSAECTLGEEGATALSLGAFQVTASASTTVQGVPASLGPSSAELRKHAGFRPHQSILPIEAARRVPLSGFALALTGPESALLGPVVLPLRVEKGFAGDLREVALFRDLDEDGAVDAGSVPVAIGQISVAAGTLSLETSPDGLLSLAAGQEHHFLITAGTSVALSESPLPPRSRPSSWPSLLAAVLLAGALLRRHPRGARRGGLLRPIHAIGLLGLVLACGRGGGGGGGSPDPAGTILSLELRPADLVLTGEVSGNDIAITGAPQSFRIRLP